MIKQVETRIEALTIVWTGLFERSTVINNSRRQRRPYRQSLRERKRGREGERDADKAWMWIPWSQTTLQRTRKTGSHSVLRLWFKKGPLFDTYAHHSVAIEPDQTPGECRGNCRAIGVMPQIRFSSLGTNTKHQGTKWPWTVTDDF